ncbi:chemotaxis protein CheW [uncultured Roseobacter sp.]|uniref:chemotaxis protein CheW n=1 Tax=uncultured Roseobacter sp. TaxID=114847 RepID=UPI00261B8990|nr:chemotaxis protein CheW [uncultured Roseobacter sp.]
MNETDVQENSEVVEFLSFRVGGEDYAIDIGSTREIRSWTTPSTLPDAPTFFLGVINLRGVMLPLLDLAARLGLPTPEVNERSVIIVAEIEDTPVGLLVEGVSDIIAPSKDEMQPPPDMANSGGDSYVQALTLVEDKTVRILDLASVMPAPEQVA